MDKTTGLKDPDTPAGFLIEKREDGTDLRNDGTILRKDGTALRKDGVALRPTSIL